ncbi:DivIVA domain-containing protein, partial [Acidimicrobiaceae bacterium USS-CC1]|nr:DivIVA domain-containing protein [Acidiferrimicrobium australe]
MEVSPKAFREVEFREKLRGYHPEDVDQFLEQMAAGVEVLQEKLRQALERAQRAEAQAAESGGSDETLRRTLVLAQRTADQAVQEAREQASHLLADAEQHANSMLAEAEERAQSTLAEAEERARRLHNEALADVRSELTKLEATRAHSQQEVELLDRWADEQRSHHHPRGAEGRGQQVLVPDVAGGGDGQGVGWGRPEPGDVEGEGAPSQRGRQPAEVVAGDAFGGERRH